MISVRRRFDLVFERLLVFTLQDVSHDGYLSSIKET